MSTADGGQLRTAHGAMVKKSAISLPFPFFSFVPYISPLLKSIGEEKGDAITSWFSSSFGSFWARGGGGGLGVGKLGS